MADLLLQKRSNSNSSPNNQVGKRWVINFVRRYQQALQTRYNRKYNYQRAKCEDPQVIRDWFRLVKNTIAKYGIEEQDIYNFDETGFQMGVISTAKVITGAERSNRPVSIQPGNREWVTAIDCISSAG
jgi:DDE superfamily endonuclease